MAKKAKKKSKKRSAKRASKSSAGGRGSASLRSVPTGQLRAELQRRSADIEKLESKRDELLARVEEIDGEISTLSTALGVSSGGGARRGKKRGRPAKSAGRAVRAGGRKRAKNAESLEVALAKTLKGKTMGVSEVADAVQKAGYKTTSPNFRTIVNQTLIKSALIKKIGRGEYTAA